MCVCVCVCVCVRACVCKIGSLSCGVVIICCFGCTLCLFLVVSWIELRFVIVDVLVILIFLYKDESLQIKPPLMHKMILHLIS